MGLFGMGKPAPMLRIVGRVNDGNTTVGYMVERMDSPGKPAYGDKAMVQTYAQQGYIENAKCVRNGDKYILRGVGTDLSTIPVIQRNKATDRMVDSGKGKKPVYEVSLTKAMVDHWAEAGGHHTERMNRRFSELIKEGGSLHFYYVNGDDRGKPYKLDMQKALETTEFVKFDRQDGEYRVKMEDFVLSRTGELLYVGVALAMRNQPDGAIGICDYKVGGQVVSSQKYAAYAAFGRSDGNHVQSTEAARQSEAVTGMQETEKMTGATKSYLQWCKDANAATPTKDAEVLYKLVKTAFSRDFGAGCIELKSACRENLDYMEGAVCVDQYIFGTNPKTGKTTAVVMTWADGDEFLAGSDCESSGGCLGDFQNYRAKGHLNETAEAIAKYFNAVLIEGKLEV